MREIVQPSIYRNRLMPSTIWYAPSAYSGIDQRDEDFKARSFYWFFFFAFAQRAWAARRIFSLRSSAVIFFAVALPPLLPRATAIGSLRFILLFISPSRYSLMHSGM